MPQNSVKNILFDRCGYCWIATEGGLVRFDNQEFRIYGLDNIPGLLDERMQVMGLDTAGNIFAKNLNGQTVFTYAVNNISSPVAALLKTTDPNYYPTTGYLTDNVIIGKLWDSLLNEARVPLIREHTHLQNDDTYLIFKDDIYFITRKTYRFLKRWPEIPVGNAPVGDSLFIQLRKGNKVALWKNGQLLAEKMLLGDITANTAFLNGSSTLFWCPTGTFVFAGKRLYKLIVEKNEIFANEVLRDLPIESPACIYYTPDNNTYYIGSLTQGLFVIKISDFKYPQIPKASGVPNFYAVGKTPDDQLIVNNTVIPANKPAYNISIHGEAFITAYNDSAGNMYYERGYSLCRFNVHTGEVKTLLPLDERLVAVLPVAGRKALLICTHKSLILLSEAGKVVWEKQLPIPYDSVKATGLYLLDSGQYLLLTNKGVKWYNLSKNKIYKSILDSLNFRSFYMDRAGRIWLGSDGGGAFMYQDGHIYKLPLGEQKSLKTVQAFIDDGRGYFWLPTNNGLFRVNINQLSDYVSHKKDELYMYILNNRDGLLTNEFNGGCDPAYQWLSDSTLALPSMNGLVEFQPMKLKINYPNSKIFLDGIRVDTTSIQLSALNEVTKLPPGFNLLNIKVSCPYFGNPGNLQLEYSIQNDDLEDRWLQVPASGLITINRLPAGRYQVIIKKAGYNPKESNPGISLQFTVLPRFYFTWWFYTLMLLLFVLTGYIFARRRIIHLKKKNLQIEQIVAVRTTELHQAVQQLKVSEGALKHSNKIKEQVIAMVLHDLRSPIRFLGTISNNLVKNFTEENSESFFGNLKKLNKSVGILWGFTDQFFSWAVSQRDEFRVKKSSFPLQEVFDEVAGFYVEILSFNGNRLLVSSTDIVCHTDKDILSLILRNLVDNANKNTEDGAITLNALKEGEAIHLTVKDTGNGLSERQVKMYMDASRGASEHGAGSIIILDMLNRIGGRLSIQTEPGAGSSFKIIL